MRWWKLLCCLLLSSPAVAAADEMDLALARLRVRAGEAGCTRDAGFCPDAELFERLVSELTMGIAQPLLLPAHTSGVRGVWIGVVHSLTTLQSDTAYWARGTRGDAASQAQELNRAPEPVLQWTRLLVRKGLPLGLELGGHVGHGLHTSMWTIGAQIKLALLEGFHSGLGRLPDVAVSVSTQALLGAQDLSLATHAVDLTLSKPLVLGGAMRLTPLLVGQVLWMWAESGFVDLDWGVCSEDDSCDSSTSDIADAEGIASFGVLRQLRLRWALGAELAYDSGRLLLSAALEAPLEKLREEDPQEGGTHVAAQVSVNAALAVEF